MSGVISRLSAMLKGGKISVKELIEAYISRIEAVNPLLNAYVYTTFEEALSKADVLQKRIAEGPWQGYRSRSKTISAQRAFRLPAVQRYSKISAPATTRPSGQS